MSQAPPPSPRAPAAAWPTRRRALPGADEPPPARRRSHGLLWLALSLVFGLITLVLLGIGAAVWLLRSEAGTAWLLPRLPGIETQGVRGALWGEFAAERMAISLPDDGRLVLSGIGWRDVRVERATPGSGARQWVRLYFGELRATRGELLWPKRDGRASAPPPTDLQLPLELEIGTLKVGELRAPGLGDQPLRDVTAHVHLGADAGALHRVDRLGIAWDRLQARGSAQIATTGALALQARVELAQAAVTDLPAWSAQATLAGPLNSPQLTATLRAQPQAKRPAQSVDARATLRPFAAWPLGDLEANARGLDLSAFHGAAPLTALDIEARAATLGTDQPASVELVASNTQPGRWNDGKLPLRRIELALSARPNDIGTLDVQRFVAELGSADRPAGQVDGSGRWSASAWNLAARLDGLLPAALDARAPAMRLSGPVTLAGGAATPAIEVKADLSGALAQKGPARAVQLAVDATVAPLRIELRRAEARAGGARATLAGTLTRTAADAPWRSAGTASLVNFDPLPWWPGGDGTAWRKGPHRLNASASFDIALPPPQPAGAAALPVARQLAALRGQADVTIAPSVLAGVALSGDATLRSTDGSAALATLALDAGANQLRASGRIDTHGNGAGDVWELKLAAPSLSQLAPVYRLLQPAGGAPLGGAVDASATLSGRWPALKSEGGFEASALRIDTVQVQKAQGRWRVATSADAPIEANVAIEQAAIAGQAISNATLQLQGTARAHTLELRASTPARPPAWLDTVQPRAAPPAPASTPAATPGSAAATPGSVATLRAEGGLVDGAGAAASGWRGRLRQVEARPRDPGAAAWLRSTEIGIELLWGGAALQARIEPGRAEILGAALRWERIEWQAAVGAAQPGRMEAKARLEPFRVAPLLARLQPEFGWGGDLTLTGSLDIRSADGFTADVVVERAQGDLSVTEETVVRALGLTDVRLGLRARNGSWSFTQGLAGSALGKLSGAVVATTSPRALWPAGDAPIQGAVELQVASLGTWGPWVPPGWRLGGKLNASAVISGRFGAPEYTGRIEGSQIEVRNFLEGVNIADCDIAIALQGTTARIERFNARAGNGTLRLAGSASLGEAPKADLSVVAQKFQLLGRVDRRIVTSGQGRLQIDRDNLRFDGKFEVDEGLIDFSRSDAPALSDDVVVRRGNQVQPTAAEAQEAKAAASGAARPNTGRTVALDLRVDLGRQLRLRGRGIDTLLQGELRATAPGGRLALNGTVQTAEGTYAAYGQKLAIDRGRISFSGPIENPRLDIEATRPNLDIRVGVAVGGTALNPRVRLFSEPEMSEVEKLSWLVLGRASEGLGRTETALLQRAAMALLAGEGPGMTDQLIKAIGLDELSVRQSDGEVRETVVSLGKQLSARWYVGYERSLTATAGTWQLVYRIARRFTLRAQSGLDNSIDLIWTWRWQ